MLSKKEKKVLLGNLPDNWKKDVGTHFGLSASYIEKVAYGSIENIGVFEYLVDLAEKNKADNVIKMANLKERITNLAKPVSA